MIVLKFIKEYGLGQSQNWSDFSLSIFGLLFYFFLDVLKSEMLLHSSLVSNLSSFLFKKYIIHLPDDLYIVYFIQVIS